MLNAMRSLSKGWIAKLLMLFLVVTFGVWGVGDIVGSSASNYAAQVGSTTISLGEFERAKAALVSRAEAIGFKGLNPQAMQMGIMRQLVQQKLLTLSLRDLGLAVNDALLAKTLRAEPAFQNEDGSFSKLEFMNFLKSERISESALTAQLKEEIAAGFMLASLDVSDLNAPIAVRTLTAASALETRDAWLITIPAAQAPDTVSPEALTAFYEKNKSVLYVKPESRTLEYVTLRPQQIDTLIERSITDAMVSETKKSQPNASTADIRNKLRRAQRETVLSNLQATLDDALAGGAALGDALSKAGLSTPIHTLNNIKEGSEASTKDEVVRTVMEHGFEMGDGETSGLLLTMSGVPFIVHVKSVVVAGAQPYEQVEADVRRNVVEQLRREATRARVQEVRDTLNKLVSSEKTVDEKQLQTVLKPFNITPSLQKTLGRPGASERAAGAISTALLQAIFERPLGAIAGPMSLPNGGQMLAIVAAIHPAEGRAVEAKAATLSMSAKNGAENPLAQTVQALGFGHFAERHRVKINGKVFSKSSSSDEETP